MTIPSEFLVSPTPENRLPFVAALLTLVLWSGTPVANKIAVDHMDSFTAGALRSAIAGIVAAGVCLAWRLPFPATARERVLLAVSGLASFAVWPAFMSIGIGRTTAGHAALIMATIPIFTVVLSAVLDRRPLRAVWWSGALIALAGAAAVVAYRSGFDGGATAAGDAIVLAGGVICAIGYVAGGKLTPRIGTVATTFWGLAIALFLLIPALGFSAGRTVWREVPLESWLAIAWMSLLSSLAGYACWFYALGHGNIRRIGTLQLAMPVITLAASALILDEVLTTPVLSSCAVIVSGTFIAQRNAS